MATLDNDDLVQISRVSKINDLYIYKGYTGNVFSIISGDFIGSIDFHGIAALDFLINPEAPPSTVPPALDNRICTLNSNDTMTNTSNIATVDDCMIFMNFVGFEAVTDVVISYFDNQEKCNVYFYIPKSFRPTELSPYYPTQQGCLSRGYLGYGLQSKTKSPFESQVYDLKYIDFDRLESPIVINQVTTYDTTSVKMLIYPDRDYTIQFNLNRDISGGKEFWFAMKNDRDSQYYDVGPTQAIITDAINGYIDIPIEFSDTKDLEYSKYYGELVMKDPQGTSPETYKYITIKSFDVEFVNNVLSSDDF